jgi:N-succinyldiaminopimelate aminotransferase
MNPIFADLPTTIFEHMSGLARELHAVNLGQGFPDFGWPDDVIEAAARALTEGSNQYPPMRGIPELREAIADHYRVHQGVDVSSDQVIVTSGGTEALTASIMAVVKPGDEVLVFQPVYDSYLPIVRSCGGVPRLASFAPPRWQISEALLAEAFTDRTRMVIINNPYNPVARAFGEDELRLLAAACVRHDAIALTDEVWEHIIFDGRRHIPLGSLPGMAERTIKVGSAGKIFSMTGWKVGWAIAPPALSPAVGNAHQFITFTTPPNLQVGVAFGLAKDPPHFDAMRATFAEARDFFLAGIAAAAVRETGVAAIPISAFFEKDPVRHVVRLCFAKKRATLEAGIERLAAARRLFAR